MKRFALAVTSCLALVLCGLSQAQTPPPVLVSDLGVETGIIGSGAPPHTIGLRRHSQTIELDTGTTRYGLRYVVARDPKSPQAAIPGEGYIGMPLPVHCNWYASGFFDLHINGRSIGTTLIHSMTGRSSPGRGTVDFVFDTTPAVVRVRFVAQAGKDCLFTQVLLEPRGEIKTMRLALRCYPSAFVSNADRHVLTPTRDLGQGGSVTLDIAKEWWTLYYDRIFDEGYISSSHSGAGPCALLWIPGQTEKARITVGSYSIDTVLDLRHVQREFRFVFFDFAGKKNEAARSDLQRRALALQHELTTLAFSESGLVRWPLSQKRAEIRQLLASTSADNKAAAQYERWSKELAALLELVRSDSQGAIKAEAGATRIIDQWERSLPELKLKALLNEI
jgi:hypothetical protein